MEEVEAAEALAAAEEEEEAPGVSESAAEDLEAEAVDPAPWGTARTWAALEADRRRTAGYEKVRGNELKKEKNPRQTWKCPGNILLFSL